MKTFLASFILFSLCVISFGQDPSNIESDDLRKDALNVYYPDASSHIKQEINYINYVRDRKVADLVIIETDERNAAGGRKYSFFFEGQNICAGMKDTLTLDSTPDDTYESRREKKINCLKKGLVRYVLKTPLGNYLDVSFSEPLSETVSTDKWNSWVFRSSLHGFGFANQSRKSYDFSTSLSASRITEDWKLDYDASYSVGLSEFNWVDTAGVEQVETNRATSSGVYALMVKSLGEHWSVGLMTSLSNSYYLNYHAHFEFKPGIEFNIYPYSQSTRKQLRFMYTIGPVWNNYMEETEYFKIHEIVGQHSLMVAYKNIQKWGDFNISTSWSNYLHDFSLSNLSFDGSVTLRVAKGLRLSLSGGYSFIHDQINLRRGNADVGDVLLSRRQLATTFSFHSFVSVSYTFGSIYSNVVNPRFSRTGGGRIIMF